MIRAGSPVAVKEQHTTTPARNIIVRMAAPKDISNDDCNITSNLVIYRLQFRHVLVSKDRTIFVFQKRRGAVARLVRRKCELRHKVIFGAGCEHLANAPTAAPRCSQATRARQESITVAVCNGLLLVLPILFNKTPARGRHNGPSANWGSAALSGSRCVTTPFTMMPACLAWLFPASALRSRTAAAALARHTLRKPVPSACRIAVSEAPTHC